MKTIDLIKSTLSGFKIWVNDKINESSNELYSTISKIKEKVDIKPDWSQNDETASDYIKNRPFFLGNKKIELISQRTLEPAISDGWNNVGTVECEKINWENNEIIIDVIFDDKVYQKCVISSEKEYIGAGVYAEFIKIGGDGYDFEIHYSDSYYDYGVLTIYTKGKDQSTHTISAYKSETAYVPIDINFLPITNNIRQPSDSIKIPTDDAIHDYFKNSGDDRLLPNRLKYYGDILYVDQFNNYSVGSLSFYNMNNGQNTRRIRLRSDDTLCITDTMDTEIHRLATEEYVNNSLINMFSFNSEGELVVTIGGVSKTFIAKE